MIVVRQRLKETIRHRFAEWVLSISMFWWGLLTLLSRDLFHNNELFTPLLEVSNQDTWGVMAAVIGGIRIVLLIINGAWRPSAHLRVIGAIAGTVIWGSLVIATLGLDWVTPNVVFFSAFLALDVISLWYSAEDAKLADLARKKV